MNRASIVGMAACVLASAFAVSGCTPGAGSSGAAGGSTLQSVLQSGTVRVGDCLSFAPFGFYDEAGKPSGYDVDIANELATQLGVKLEVIDTTADNRIPNLQTNKVDVVFCNFTRTGARQKQIEFTDPYVVAGEGLLVKKNSGITSIKDMNGKTVAVVKGSTNGDAVMNANPQAKVQQYDTTAAAILAVQQGQAAAMVEDTNFLAYQAKLDPTLTVTADSLVALEYNGFGVKQGDQTWLNWLNGFLFRLNTSGKNAELYEKWFGVPPRYPLNPQY